jgi:hypothetical protein
MNLSKCGLSFNYEETIKKDYFSGFFKVPLNIV